jgi:chromosome segregation ATPase
MLLLAAVCMGESVSLLEDNKATVVPLEERFKAAPKGSLAGPEDPGFGPASASRTDLQRTHEAAEAARNQQITDLIRANKYVPPSLYDQMQPASSQDEKATTRGIKRRIRKIARAATQSKVEPLADTLANIKRTAARIKRKYDDAKQEVKRAAKQADADAKRVAREHRAQAKLSPAERKQAQLLAAEESKLRAEETKNLGPEIDSSGVDSGTKVMQHKSGNWVRSDRSPSGEHFEPKGDSRHEVVAQAPGPK